MEEVESRLEQRPRTMQDAYMDIAFGGAPFEFVGVAHGVRAARCEKKQYTAKADFHIGFNLLGHPS